MERKIISLIGRIAPPLRALYEASFKLKKLLKYYDTKELRRKCHPEVPKARHYTRNWLGLLCHPEPHEQRMKASAYPFNASANVSGSQARDSELAIAPQNDIICHCGVPEARQDIRGCINPMRHCGLDPQSQNSEEVTTMRFRVKHGMTECACHCEGAKRSSQSHCNMPKAVTNGSPLTVNSSQISCHPELVSGSQNDAIKETPTRKSKISTLPSREGKHAPQALTGLSSYRLNDLTSSKKAAFTLAEVLITLAIIGIVATMTIPTLVNNYKKKAIITNLKNTYSTMVRGLNLSEIDNGPMEYWPENASLDLSEFFTNYIKPYFKAETCFTLKTCGYKEDVSSIDFRLQWSNAAWLPMTSSSGLLFQLSNGSIVYWTKNTYDANWNIVYTNYIFVDVNGAKGPNTYCKDVFPFIRSNGSIRPRPNTCTEIIQNNSWTFPEDYSW